MFIWSIALTNYNKYLSADLKSEIDNTALYLNSQHFIIKVSLSMERIKMIIMVLMHCLSFIRVKTTKLPAY